MKKALVARGFLGLLSLVGVSAGLVACGAEMGDPGSEAEVENTSQALNQALTAGPTALMFPSFVKFSNSQVLTIGGLTAAGVGQSKVALYDRSTDAWNDASYDDLPAGAQRGLALIAKVPNTSKYLVSGGVDNGAVLNTAWLFDPTAAAGNNPSSQWVQVGNMSVGRFATTLEPCGNAANSKLVTFGGMTSVGAFASSLSGTATATNEVFSYNAGTPSASSWARLKDSSNANLDLTTAVGFHGTLDLSTTSFRVFGGTDSAAGVSQKVVQFDVNTSCASATKTAKNDMKVGATNYPRAKFGFATISEAVGGVTYNVLVGGGTDDDNGTVPTQLLRYSTANDQWDDTFATQLATGREFPVAVQHATNDVAFVGGVQPDAVPMAHEFQTTVTTYDKYVSGGGGTLTQPNATAPEKQLATSRVGHWALMLNNNLGNPSLTAGLGSSWAVHVGTLRSSVE